MTGSDGKKASVLYTYRRKGLDGRENNDLQDLLNALTQSSGELTAVIFIGAYPTFDGLLVFSDGTSLDISTVHGTGRGVLGSMRRLA